MIKPGYQDPEHTGPGKHQARKRFGQNFLVDEHIIAKIAHAIGPKAADNLVEIGPGQGAITALILAKCPRLQAIELDRDLVPILEKKFVQHPEFTIYQADALAFDFASLSENGPLRIVGNLPYNISTPLIFHLLSFKQYIQDMHFMLQKEVVDRMAAAPGDKTYGRLSIMCQYHCSVMGLFDVPPHAFRPVPKVNSAIVRLVPHRTLPFTANNVALLATVVKTVFQMRRKTLRNGLKPLLAAEQLDALNTNLNLRPEALSVQDFVELSNEIAALPSTTND